MIDRSTARLGGSCSIVVGVLALVVGVTYFLVPPEQNPAVPTYSSAYFASIHANSLGQEILYWSLLFMAVFGVAVVSAVSGLVRQGHEACVRWASTLAMIGLGIQIAANALGRDYVLRVAPVYMDLGAAAREAINLQGNLYNDWISFALVGFWLVVVNVLLFRNGVFGRSLALVGLVAGVAYEIVALSNVIENLGGVTVAIVIGIIALPLWHIWVGILLLLQHHEA